MNQQETQDKVAKTAADLYDAAVFFSEYEEQSQCLPELKDALHMAKNINLVSASLRDKLDPVIAKSYGRACDLSRGKTFAYWRTVFYALLNTPQNESHGKENDNDIKKTLLERGKSHGEFSKTAKTSQKLKRVMVDSENWGGLTLPQREALEMVMHKAARILNGNPNVRDHWIDIAGYSSLEANRLGESS